MLVESIHYGAVRVVLQDNECLALATALEAVIVCDGVPEFQEPPEWNAHLETVFCLLKAVGQQARDKFLGLDVFRERAESAEAEAEEVEE